MKKIACLVCAVALMAMLCACESMDYKKAVAAYDDGDYEAACEMFEALGDYEDSAEMVKACNYEIACKMMDKKEYGEAAKLFETLDGYKDSAEKLEKCTVSEIDALIQGSWQGQQNTIIMGFDFTDGRFKATMSIGTSSLSNEGSYRIDVVNKEVYICYDYIISTTGKTPNTEEQVLFTYTYDGQDFVLNHSLAGALTKK